MYYLINQNEQIIAADDALLQLLGVESIAELYQKIALGETLLTLNDSKKITIKTPQNSVDYEIEKSTLSGILGEMTLIEIQLSQERLTFADNEISASVKADEESEPDISKEEEIPLFDDDFIDIKESSETVSDNIPVEDEALASYNEADTISLIDITDTNEDNVMDITDISETNFIKGEEVNHELFDLSTPEEPEKPVDENSAIVIDAQLLSQKIGISVEDYSRFLDEYIDTAISLEKDLQSDNKEKRSAAIETLSHLSEMLHISVLNELIQQIKTLSLEEQRASIESFYATLARLTINTKKKGDIFEETVAPTPEPETVEVETVEVETDTTDTRAEGENMKSFGTISLDDVKPVHFDFQLEEAANDLSLPVELIEEFVFDFIEQSHIETKKMLKAYEEGELHTIQKIGHLLKGVSSNLRIKPLADTLYEIQFCEESSKLEALIKQYWAHFLSFETRMNATAK